MAAPVDTEEQELVDGRSQRSARSRARIVDALLELVQEGELLPTGEQVAARAGVGLRTVFRHFDDMEGLNAELETRVRGLVAPLREMPPPRGELGTRVRELVRRRSIAFERIAPFKRSEQVQRWRSAALQESHARMLRELGQTLVAVLPELASTPVATRQAIELLCSFEAWDKLRTDQGLGRERAQEVIIGAVITLID